jgi:AraC family transcriptional regulator of adaptative response / DNA-3-methyladenine glycosylase II
VDASSHGSALDAATCYRALVARDLRFDGIFYVGVSTTGIYCRPICPARTPGAPRCTFFRRAAEAERAGFRACFRCRPELAPGQAAVDSLPRLVAAAASRIDAGYLNEHSIDELAAGLGVSARHLRRAHEAALGVSPVELAQSKRLALAKQLLADTNLPVTEVAFAAGFSSVRRFNALVRARFGRAPSALRGGVPASDHIPVRLDYRPPLAWPALLAFLRGRAIPGVEEVTDSAYRRVVRIGAHSGSVTVSHHHGRAALQARVSLTLAPVLMEVVARLRALFDLDARPDVVAAQLGPDALLRPLLRARPGLRVPGAFDNLELAIRAVLGQQVSVRAATTLSGRLAQHFGGAFPSAATLAAASLPEVQALGLPAARARTLLTLGRAVADGAVDLGRGADPARALTALQELPGIGPWTAHYIAMRALRWPDAFPAGDLALRKALGAPSTRAVEARAQAWQPWRAYAVMHLWASLGSPTRSTVATQGG